MSITLAVLCGCTTSYFIRGAHQRGGYIEREYSHDVPIRRRKHGYILTTDQSYAGSAGIFSRRTNRTQRAWVYSHNGPIRCRKRGYTLTADQSETRETRVCSQGGPIRRRRRVYILTADQSDAGGAGIFSRRTKGLWGVECTLAVIGTGGPVK